MHTKLKFFLLALGLVASGQVFSHGAFAIVTNPSTIKPWDQSKYVSPELFYGYSYGAETKESADAAPWIFASKRAQIAFSYFHSKAAVLWRRVTMYMGSKQPQEQLGLALLRQENRPKRKP